MREAPRGVMDASYARDRGRRADLDFRLRSRAWAVVEAVRRERHEPLSAILDLGTADGRTMALVHQWLRPEVSIGIEASEELVAAAPELPHGCSIIHGDLTRELLELEGARYDLVTALALLEHLRDPRSVLDLAWRHLRPGGLLIATAPVGFWDSASGLLRLHREEHHEWKVTPKRLREVASSAGFDWVEHRRFMWVPVASLPYLGIRLGHRLAARIDSLVRAVRLLDCLFVNQVFVMRRPEPATSPVRASANDRG